MARGTIFTRLIPFARRASAVGSQSLAAVNKPGNMPPAGAAAWQRPAWDFYDQIGELRFAVGWLANACSRATLYVGKIDPTGQSEPSPVQDPALTAPLDALGSASGRAELVRRIATHLTVAGESFLISWDDPDTGEQRHRAACAEEITFGGPDGRIWLADAATGTNEQLPTGAISIRIHRPHPRRAAEPDSPVRPLLTELRKLVMLSDHVIATADSRLAGAGILAVPESATVLELAAPAGVEAGELSAHGTRINPETGRAARSPKRLHSDPLMAELIRSMITPIGNRKTAAAVVPIALRIKDDACDKIKHLSFSTPFDTNIKDLTEGTLRRIALGMDLPPEIMLGIGGLNHWSAWQLEESAIKLHIAPLLGLICGVITEQWYRPLVGDDTDSYAICANLDELSRRPTNPEQALALYKEGLISREAARGESGWNDDDAPSHTEWREWLLTRIAAHPAMAPYVLPELGIDILPGAPSPTGGAPALPAADGDGGTAPSTSVTKTPPAPPAGGESAAVRAACAVGVLRALEVAGKRLLTSHGARAAHRGRDPWTLHTVITVDPDELDRLLDGAWGVLAAALANHRDRDRLVAVCASHTRHLLTHARAFDADALDARLQACQPSGRQS